jgi:hypothetical protein
MKPMRHWMILMMAMFSIACLVQAGATPVLIAEVPVEEPFVEPTGTPGCQPSPAVTLDVRRIDPSSVWLHASGLQPGETPRVIYGASAKGEGMYADLGEFRDGADQQGEFFMELSGLELGQTSLEGSYTATWDIRLIHARGVACATITLP